MYVHSYPCFFFHMASGIANGWRCSKAGKDIQCIYKTYCVDDIHYPVWCDHYSEILRTTGYGYHVSTYSYPGPHPTTFDHIIIHTERIISTFLLARNLSRRVVCLSHIPAARRHVRFCASAAVRPQAAMPVVTLFRAARASWDRDVPTVSERPRQTRRAPRHSLPPAPFRYYARAHVHGERPGCRLRLEFLVPISFASPAHKALLDLLLHKRRASSLPSREHTHVQLAA